MGDAVIIIYLAAFVGIIILLKNLFVTRQRDRLRADLYTKAIEKGKEIPTNLFESNRKKSYYLPAAIILITFAVGFSLFLFCVAGDNRTAAAGLVPLFVGFGFLLIHFIQRKEK